MTQQFHSWAVSHRTESRVWKRYLYIHVPSHIVRNSQNWMQPNVWMQPKCPWRNVLSHPTAWAWMNLEYMLSETNQSQKTSITGFHSEYVCNQIQISRKSNGGYQELRGGGKGDLSFNGYRISIWEDENVLEISLQQCECT